jgi:hypothetical protein
VLATVRGSLGRGVDRQLVVESRHGVEVSRELTCANAMEFRWRTLGGRVCQRVDAETGLDRAIASTC